MTSLPINSDWPSDERTDTQKSSSTKSIKCLFQKASDYLSPGRTFRTTVHLYAERKFFVFFMMHFISTMIIWAHFFYIKFEQQKFLVPLNAPFYWLKRIVPPIEFGAMHAILFQMALIPLTMSRYSIAALSGGLVDKFIPLNRTLRMHIHLGYTTVIIVFLGTILFLGFFGFLCNRGQQEFCEKFTSEIMCTGYGILASLLIVVISSHLRGRIPYEVFYVVHHLVFIMYAITIAHTLDVQQRQNKLQRSQTFKWFSATILYYVCDRVAMHLNHKYRSRLVSSSTVVSSDGSKMIILNIRRPILFSFRPGQYAYLRVRTIDVHWHPFSIASDPASSDLVFYIEVHGDRSWSEKLWKMLEEENRSDINRNLDVEVMGPYGSPLANISDFSHMLAIGTGTGIVPIISLLKQQVNQLLRLDPVSHFEDIRKHREKVENIENAEQSRRGTFFKRIARSCRPRKRYVAIEEAKADVVRESIKYSISRCDHERLSIPEERSTMSQMKLAAFQATRSIYGTVALCVAPVIGLTLVGLMLSWNTINAQVQPGMTLALKYFTVGFQVCFAVVTLFIWDTYDFLAYIDIAMTVISPFADWFYVLQCDNFGFLSPGELTLYSLLIGYMVIRLWIRAVVPCHRTWRSGTEEEGVRSTESFHIVWVCRSASLVSEILPDVNKIWVSLSAAWGKENASKVCRISIYVTDEDPGAQLYLEKEFYNLELYQKGCLYFTRPDFPSLITDHVTELIATTRNSHSLLAYVGSPHLAGIIHRCKISNDIVTAITGHQQNHTMDYVSESYGGTSKKRNFTEVSRIDSVKPQKVGRTQSNESKNTVTSYSGQSRWKITSYDNSFLSTCSQSV